MRLGLRRSPRLLVAVAAAVLLAGCSSGDDGPTASDTSAASPTTIDVETSSTDDGGGDGVECPSPAASVPTGRSEATVSSGGRDRAYLRYVPEGVAADEPAPLIVDLTAYSPAALQESFSGFTVADDGGSVKADEVGAVVVTPEPVNGVGLLTWNLGDTPGWTDDQRFIADLLDAVAADLCIDPDRVLVTGFAIGAVMASTLACEQPERIAAIAAVAGLWDPPACDPAAQVPVLSFHGTGDEFLPFEGGVGGGAGGLGLSPETTAGLVEMASRPGAVESAQAWADRNGCPAPPTTTSSGPGVELLEWDDCDADVALHVIEGGTHTWPGSDGMAVVEDLLGIPSDAIDATDVIWAFFLAQTGP